MISIFNIALAAHLPKGRNTTKSYWLPLWFFIIIFFFFPPILVNAYITKFALILLASSIFLFGPLLKSKIKLPVEYIIPYLLLLIGCILSLFNSISELNSLWDIRDSIRVFLALLFFISLYSYIGQKNYLEIDGKLKGLFCFLVIYITIEGVLSIIWFADLSSLSFLSIYNVFSERGYTYENYWRYLGLWGNPNYTAMFTAMSLMYVWHMQKDFTLNKIGKILAFSSLLIGFFALLTTASRSVFAALGISIILAEIYRPSFKKVLRLILIASIIAGGIVYLTQIINMQYIYSRMINALNYSENPRAGVVLEYLNFYQENMEVFLFGTFSLDLPLPFMDNDYLFYITKFGVMGLLFIISLLIILVLIGRNIQKLEKRKSRGYGKFLIHLAIFSAILGIASNPFSHPGALFLIIFFQVIGIYKIKKLQLIPLVYK